MASAKLIKQVVALLNEGLPSSDIAQRLNISPPVVWGIKAHWRLGKYSDPSTVESRMNESPAVSASQKANFIVNGFFKSAETAASSDEAYRDAANEFALLLAQLTSNSKPLRDSAKKSIRELAVAGGFVIPHAKDGEPSKDAESEPINAVRKKTRWRRWTDEDQQFLINEWNDSHSSRDKSAVVELGARLERTPLAIIIQLHKLALISFEVGDELCIATNSAVLLSERFTPSASHPQASNEP